MLSVPVFAVELATSFNLFSYYEHHEVAPAALLLAVSFSALLVGTAMLVAQPTASAIRALLIAGGFLTFLAQAMANMSEAFLRAQQSLPAARLSQFWNQTPQDLTIHSAIIYGSVINVVGLFYWLALALFFRAQREEQERAQERLQEFLRAERS